MQGHSDCLSVCMFEYVRASKSVRGCLSAFLSPRGGRGGLGYVGTYSIAEQRSSQLFRSTMKL